MQNIIIDQEFKELLPRLDAETLALLEENILLNGCRDSLVLWGDVLIDGHNRYEICTRNKVPFTTINREFDSREAVLIWIVSTQIARRNLSPLQLSNYRGMHYLAEKKMQGVYNRYAQESKNRQNVDFQKPQRTSDLLAQKYHVSHRTIERDAKIAEAIEAIGKASPDARQRIINGEVSFDKQALQILTKKPAEEIADLATEIEQGTYVKPKPVKAVGGTGAGSVAGAVGQQLDIKQLNTAMNMISTDFSTQWQSHFKAADKPGMMQALRLYLDKLEALYQGR